MNDCIEKAKKINKAIKDLKITRNFLESKKLITESERINNIKNELLELKEALCKTKDKKILEKYNIIEEKLKNDHLIIQNSAYKKELQDLLEDISNILS